MMTSLSLQHCPHCQASIQAKSTNCPRCGKSLPSERQTNERFQFTRIQEQSQSAYSILVPKGWHYAAHITRYPDGNAIQNWQVRNPAGSVTVSCPGTNFSFQEPTMPLFGGPFPGRRPMPYVPAHIFIQNTLLPQLRASTPHMQVERITPHPELIEELRRRYSSTGQDPTQVQFDIASIQVQFMQQGRSFRQSLVITTLRLPALRLWDACISGQVSAPADQFETYTDLLLTISKSFQWNKQWLQAVHSQNQRLAGQITRQAQMRMQQAQMQALQVQHQSILEVGDIARRSQARQMAAQSQQFNAMDNIIAGTHDLRDPYGRVYHVTNDYQPRHWIDGLGRIHGGNWNTTPQPGWTPLESLGS